MKQTSLQGMANKAANDKTYRFRNLFGLLTAGFLFLCWDYISRKASPGVDRIDAGAYEENLAGNIQQLAQQAKGRAYRAKLVLRKWIPKAGGKLRPLGIPSIADKLLQCAAAKILETVYGQGFLPCSYGCRPGTGARNAIKALTGELNSRKYHLVVEAGIKGYFNAINHDLLLEMLKIENRCSAFSKSNPKVVESWHIGSGWAGATPGDGESARRNCFTNFG